MSKEQLKLLLELKKLRLEITRTLIAVKQAASIIEVTK